MSILGLDATRLATCTQKIATYVGRAVVLLRVVGIE